MCVKCCGILRFGHMLHFIWEELHRLLMQKRFEFKIRCICLIVLQALFHLILRGFSSVFSFSGHRFHLCLAFKVTCLLYHPKLSQSGIDVLLWSAYPSGTLLGVECWRLWVSHEWHYVKKILITVTKEVMPQLSII